MVANAKLSQFTLDIENEARTYHNTGKVGFFSLLVGREKKQTSHRLTDMPAVLSAVDPTHDTWLSQAEFMRPNRRVVNLLRIGLLFADLDTYHTAWAAGRTPEGLAAAVLHYCHEEGIPTPSLLVYSGRGLQAKWLLDGTLPRQALPRWNACQRHLIDRLAWLGADPAARDASRVLRLVKTVNSRSGEICRVVHVTTGQDGEPIRYNFEYLATELLPVDRQTIEQQRRDRAELRQFKLLRGGKTDGLRGFSSRQLSWDRLEDLRRLAQLRGGVVEGERMKHLFWRLNFLLLSGATNSNLMYYEATELAKELDPSWSHRSRELMTLYNKAKAYEAGERVTFGSKTFSPLYTPRNSTIINLFQITDDEQRELGTIISRDLTLERDRKRDEVRRRAAGVMDRETYLKAAEAKVVQKRAQAQALRAEGLSVRAIAQRMGASIGAVSGYLKGSSDKCSGVPPYI